MKGFTRHEPRVQDHTAMSVLNECDRKYFYRIVLGRVSQQQYNQILLDAGTLYHKFREVLEITYKATNDVDKAFNTAIVVVVTGKLTAPPENSKWGYIDRGFIVKCCALAFKWWKKEKEDGKVRVLSTEQPFNCRTESGTFIGGRADEIIEWGGSKYGRDFKFSSKTTEMWDKLINPNEQATRYTYGESQILGEKVDGVIFEVLHHWPPNKKEKEAGTFTATIFPKLASRTDSELEEWDREYEHINRQLELNRQYDIWPKRDFKTNCSWCEYAIVCRQANEAAAMAKLEQNYSLQPWDFEHVDQEVIEG
jgi:hypothetical protein